MLIAVYILLMGYNGYSASLIEKAIDDEPLLKASHPLQKYAIWKTLFIEQNEGAFAYFNWGVQSKVEYAPN